ncbi:glycosyl transferase family 90 [Pseudoalteromonas sp. C8]|uniref:glycosyl transferase family 90 n=1 Tax=Pseudoalteromonas sp. C8 TaxID=2686345 RepID=UPI0013FD90C1|nr:glycosyl transferase family 90 [Pseudoalteromonas sp. C8]
MRKLYIHIGFHKTGSTSIQHSLKDSLNDLQLADWDFLYTHPSGNSSEVVKVESDFVNAKYSIKNKFFEILKSTSKNNVVFSAEHLCFITNPDEINKICEFAKSLFDEVHIIAFLRRQDKLARSFKEQSAKTVTYKSNPGSILMGHSPEPLPEVTIKVLEYFDFSKKIKLWIDSFGSNYVKVFDFDVVKKEGLCRFFSKVIGLPFELNEVKVNESLALNQNRYWHLFAQFGLNDKQLSDLKKIIKPNKNKVLLHKEDALSFLNVFDESNKKLSKQLAYKSNFFDNEMGDYEDGEFKVKPLDIDLLIRTLCKYQYGLNIDKVVDSIRDSAINSLNNGSNLTNAYDLLTAANKIRPQGVLIKNKKAYAEFLLGEKNGVALKTDLERLDYYMPFTSIRYKNNKVDSKKITTDKIFSFKKNTFKDVDIAKTYLKDLEEIFESIRGDVVIPVQLGDKTLTTKPKVAFVKARKIGCQKSILLKLNTNRHWKYDISGDISWESKLDSAIWRGATTGYDDKRAIFVEKYHNAYDVGFSKVVQGKELDGNYFKPYTSIAAQLKNKFIISLEGNDVATNLKWVLESNSVPIMCKPTKETWLMEGLLEPYVHYLPLDDDYSNLEELLGWAKAHDAECKSIALNGKKYMTQFKDDTKELYLQRMLVMQYLGLNK